MKERSKFVNWLVEKNAALDKSTAGEVLEYMSHFCAGSAAFQYVFGNTMRVVTFLLALACVFFYVSLFRADLRVLAKQQDSPAE